MTGIVENFSAGYWIAPRLRVTPYTGDHAICQDTIYDELVYEIGEPLIGTVGGQHFEIHPAFDVPHDWVGVPKLKEYAAHHDDVLLIWKRSLAGLYGP